MKADVGPAPVATRIGELTGTSSIAVVLKPSRLARPGPSGPKLGWFRTRALVAGAKGSSGSVDPSSSRFDGRGTVPALASMTGCASDTVDLGAIWKVVIVPISVLGNSVSITG